MAKKIEIEEVNAFIRQFKLLIAGLVILFVVPLFIYAYYLEHRFDSVSRSLRYQPPQEIEHDDETAVGDMFHLEANLVSGQVVYVPAYSHVYHGDGEPYLLTVTLSVRNTSMDQVIFVKSVRYFNTKGQAVKSYLPKPVKVAPLGAAEVLIERDDASGGSGASFLVEWFSNRPVTEPIIEAIMIDTEMQQGISFARRGSVISEAVPAEPAIERSEVEPQATKSFSNDEK